MINNISRIEVDSKKKSSEAKVLEKKLASICPDISIEVSKVYTIQFGFSETQIDKIADALHNPVVETVRIDRPSDRNFDWALELGFLPGVTDNTANTTTEMINDLFKIEIGRNKVFSSKMLFITGSITEDQVKTIAEQLINILIERYHIKSYAKYFQDNGMDKKLPRVNLEPSTKVLEIDLDIPDQALADLGKKGIQDPDTGERRGPLAMDLDYLKAIKTYFEKEKRNPTDIELEAIAQTWSEHCKHTIFAAELDDIKEGIFKRYIRGATEKIRKDLKDNDFCISVFKDNSGGIIFDNEFMITHKVETHNSPSALDPFGGAITGIVGVNRDTLGFGLGAKPITNIYGYCFGKPEDTDTIYRRENQDTPVLSPRRILDGVIYGVNVGGNCSGIPTPNGFLFFDDAYKGKPLVFVGTVGILPRTLPDQRKGHVKTAQPDDNIVMIGGRVGKDGIHGATFSSEALDKGSPATAVQIGDPITQKKLSDAICKEARDRYLYNCITDNGAGGLSSSVGEMAEDCGGFTVELEKVPLKYPGLQPWETWISESQERMTLAVSDRQLEGFMKLMEQRGVEATVIGRFNTSGRAKVNLNKKPIFDLDMDFWHNGLPDKTLKTKPYPYINKLPELTLAPPETTFRKLLQSHNQSSFEFISKQYDHEVQNNSVLKPLQGKGRVNGNASVIRPLLHSRKGAVLSQALYPRLSEISCYDMAACAIDTAIRNCVAAGADPDHLALLDNFCWCSSDEPERLHQLKDTAKACYDTATAFMTPFISGKDSMFNDFKGFDKDSNRIKISVLPTLLISSIGVIDDIDHTCSMDLKKEGDHIYIIGETKGEFGGSDLYHVMEKEGGTPPTVDPDRARILYRKIHQLHKKDMFTACNSVTSGGIAMTIAKMCIAGQKGASIDITRIPGNNVVDETILYSETQSRFIITIDPKDKEDFECEMENFIIGLIGEVTDNDKLKITDTGEEMINIKIEELDNIYRERFKDY
ncbi:AIR synthase-related protein [Nanoarchaeota archaeon]